MPRGRMAGWTALHMAANGKDKGGFRPLILKELLRMGADHAVLHNGNNWLFKVAGTGNAEAVHVSLGTGVFDAKAQFKGKSLADMVGGNMLRGGVEPRARVRQARAGEE